MSLVLTELETTSGHHHDGGLMAENICCIKSGKLEKSSVLILITEGIKHSFLEHSKLCKTSKGIKTLIGCGNSNISLIAIPLSHQNLHTVHTVVSTH